MCASHLLNRWLHGVSNTGEQEMVQVSLEQIQPFSLNPRVTRNPGYDALKASILARGLDNPPVLTRRPGDEKYMLASGGNTRFAILNELWQETQDERYYRVCWPPSAVPARSALTWGSGKSISAGTGRILLLPVMPCIPFKTCHASHSCYVSATMNIPVAGLMPPPDTTALRAARPLHATASWSSAICNRPHHHEPLRAGGAAAPARGVLQHRHRWLWCAQLIQLPKGQVFALLEGGQLWKIRLPLSVTDKHYPLPESVAQLAAWMQARQQGQVE